MQHVFVEPSGLIGLAIDASGDFSGVGSALPDLGRSVSCVDCGCQIGHVHDIGRDPRLRVGQGDIISH